MNPTLVRVLGGAWLTALTLGPAVAVLLAGGVA